MNEVEQANLEPVDEWINSRCFWVIKCLIYVSAPVLYVDIVQAALCDKLGANKTVASLPATAYRLGAIAPVIANMLSPRGSVIAYPSRNALIVRDVRGVDVPVK